MNVFLDIIVEHLRTIDWQGPAAFVVVVLALFAFLRKFSIVLLIIFIVVLSWGAEDLIILNLDTQDQLISAPLLIYIIGGLSVLLLAFYSFYRSK